jgi:hypothetical protein
MSVFPFFFLSFFFFGWTSSTLKTIILNLRGRKKEKKKKYSIFHCVLCSFIHYFIWFHMACKTIFKFDFVILTYTYICSTCISKTIYIHNIGFWLLLLKVNLTCFCAIWC